MHQLRPAVHKALDIEKPWEVYWSALDNGHLALLNFTGRDATVRLPGGKTYHMDPYSMAMETDWR